MVQNHRKPYIIDTSSKCDLVGSRQFGVNDARTCVLSDTRLTQACSLPVRCEKGVRHAPK